MRRWIRNALFLTITVSISGIAGPASGYMTDTHQLINGAIFNVSAMQGYFANELKMPLTDPQAQRFQGQKALDLLKSGGVTEDIPNWYSPYLRSINHFHDPTKPWEAAGLTSASGLSNILWAQYGRLTNPPSVLAAPNDWTWDNAVQYFRVGLTDNVYATRDQNLANLFSALGHLTHLVADVSVPEHSRNDIHVLPCIEDWIKANLTRINDQIGGLPVYRDGFPPDPGIFAQSQAQGFFGNGKLFPITNLWDSNPNKTAPGNGYYNRALQGSRRLEGLADYSNFNYFSDDSVFTAYAYPSYQGATPYVSQIQQAVPGYDYYVADNVVYFRGKTSDGKDIPHLAAAGLLYQEWSQLSPALQQQVPAHLDSYCYSDYSSNLLPRAVSYGTALVNYYFRGKFDASTAPDGRNLRVTNQSTVAAHGQVTVYQDAADGTRTAVWISAVTDWAAQGQSGSILDFPFPSVGGGNYLLVFTGDLQVPGSTAMDCAVAGKAFTWTAPQTTFPVAWRPVPTLPVPDPVPTHRSHNNFGSTPPGDYQRYPVPSGMVPVASFPPSSYPGNLQTGAAADYCYHCHYFGSRYPTYGAFLVSPRTNLELCKNCHGRRASANPVSSLAPPRILVSPEAADPAWKASSVTTFNPKSGDTVRGVVQFLPAIFDYAMGGSETQGPFYYRVEIRSMDGQTLLTCFPGRNGSEFAWRKASGFVFLRDWTDLAGGVHQEKLVWDSTSVPNGSYRVLFFPMRDPAQYPGQQIGSAAEAVLTVQN